MDKEISSGTVVSRRWVLGVAVASAQACLATTVGALVYEATEKEPEETAVTPTSPTVSSEANVSGGLKRLGTVGWNPDYTGLNYTGYGFPLVDRMRTLDNLGFEGSSDAVYLDTRGYPIPPGPGRTYKCLVNVEGRYGPAAKQRYVYESNIPGVRLNVLNAVNASTQVVNGVTHYSFNMPASSSGGYPFVGLSQATYFYFGYDHPVADGQYISCFRADEEAEFRSGNMLRQQYIDWHMGFGGNRYMDWMYVNAASDMSGISRRNSLRYNPRPPIEILAEYSNRTDQACYITFPHNTSDQDLVATTTYLLGAVADHLLIPVECSNEVWNQSFHGQYSATFTIRGGQQVPHTVGGGENAGYGWMAAMMMAKVLKAANYNPRIRPVLGTQNWNSNVTEGILQGIAVAIADWNDQSGRYRNAEFAARFKYPSDIFAYLAPAGYIDADFGSYNLLDANSKATIDALASRTDGSGVTAVFQQLYHGNVWSCPSGTYLDNWTNLFAPQVAIAVREGLEPILYEEQVASEFSADPKRKALWLAVLHDPRMKQFMVDKVNANLNAGFSAGFVLSDVAEPNSTYGASDYAYDQSAPRYQGAKLAQARPVAPKPLTITVTTTGNLQVTRSPVQQIGVTGGRGVKTVTVTGLAPGQAIAARGRIITGTLTTTGTYNTIVSVTDEWGGTASYTLTQTVVASSVLPTGRYLRLVVNETAASDNRHWYADIDYLGVMLSDGTARSATWRGSNDRARGLAVEGDGDGNSFFAGPVGYVDMSAVGDLGASTQVSAIVMKINGAPGSAPGKFTVSLSDNPDGSGGTVILNVNEPNPNKWQNPRRVFELT